MGLDHPLKGRMKEDTLISYFCSFPFFFLHWLKCKAVVTTLRIYIFLLFLLMELRWQPLFFYLFREPNADLFRSASRFRLIWENFAFSVELTFLELAVEFPSSPITVKQILVVFDQRIKLRNEGGVSGFRSCDWFRSTMKDGYFFNQKTSFWALLSWSLTSSSPHHPPTHTHTRLGSFWRDRWMWSGSTKLCS